MNDERRYTDEERQEKHYEKYGTTYLPPGGTGLELNSIKLLKGLGNPEVGVVKTDVTGLIVGGLVGLCVAKKWPHFIIKGIGVIAGAELGILLARLIGGSNEQV